MRPPRDEKAGRCCTPSASSRQRPGPREGAELLDVEQLVSHAAVEALDEGVLPGGAGLDVGDRRAGQATPVPQRPGDELGTIIHPLVPGRSPLGDEALDDGDDLIGVAAAADAPGQGFTGVLVDDVQQLPANSAYRLPVSAVRGEAGTANGAEQGGRVSRRFRSGGGLSLRLSRWLAGPRSPATSGPMRGSSHQDHSRRDRAERPPLVETRRTRPGPRSPADSAHPRTTRRAQQLVARRHAADDPRSKVSPKTVSASHLLKSALSMNCLNSSVSSTIRSMITFSSALSCSMRAFCLSEFFFAA